MSFSFEFVATCKNASTIVAQEYAPEEVKDFLFQALQAFDGGALVAVKAVGHLYNKDHPYSSAQISVTPVALRVPKE